MSSLLDITGDDIGQLNDTELRSLVGLLCEADYRFSGQSTAGVTYGGHQDASDGGLDVVVNCEEPPVVGYIKRASTGIQVKKPKMPPMKILKEMRPYGVLRDEIKCLIKDSGAYIIVSSGDSTSYTSLKKRINAMYEAIADEKVSKKFLMEFFDRVRVATWVRSHPSMILWVRNRIGRKLIGWRPYENWSNASGGIKNEYLVDDGFRLHNVTRPKDNSISIEEGISKLRASLSLHKSSVRLTGLAGVGKTRLVQALFDERIGVSALNQSQVFYSDMSDSPEPEPGAFAEQIIANGSKAILIVDNCSPNLHFRLTKICSEERSEVSLLTVEYDVRDDIPEETSVYRLEPASVNIIEKLVNERFPHISQVDARKIAEFSGGNARIAIVLANTVEKGESLSGFHNDELFDRLFTQRHNQNENLLVSAEAFSLVYSFKGTDADTDNSELAILASLVKKSGAELYRDVNILKDRDLIQSRSVWRAVLPPAIANRLAKRALQRIPKSTLVQGFLHSGSERLILSFTRRLSCLHDCDIAVEIVNDWLKADGWVGENIGSLSSFGIKTLNNIAPVSPERTLDAIERIASKNTDGKFTSRKNPHFSNFTKLLKHLAYEQKLFKRSAKLLCQFALSEKPGENKESIRNVLGSLFYIKLSGTHASAEDRACIIEDLINSASQEKQELGLLLLDAALETWGFSSSYNFSFGAWPRDYGFYPKNKEEIINWYKKFIEICTNLANLNKPIAREARRVFANNFRGLWTYARMYDVLENVSQKIHENQVWNEGWVAVRGVIRLDGKGFKEEVMVKLCALEKALKPNSLLERARTYALTDDRLCFNLDDDFDEEDELLSGMDKAHKTTKKLGQLVANDDSAFKILLPELVSSSHTRLFSFGEGLAIGATDKKYIWKALYDQIVKTPHEDRQIGVLLGYLSSLADSDSEFVNSTLDNLINDNVLGEWFPVFQVLSGIDKRGLNRLHLSLAAGKASIYHYGRIALGRSHETINDNDLVDLLKVIASKGEGEQVVIEILKMRFHKNKGDDRDYSHKLIGFARESLAEYSFNKSHRRLDLIDYDLVHISNVCLVDVQDDDAAKRICVNVTTALNDNRISFYYISKFLNNLASSYPMIFLDTFIEDDSSTYKHNNLMWFNSFEGHENPFNKIPDEIVLSWCELNPKVRCPLIAYFVRPFAESKESGELVWRPFIYAFFKKNGDLRDLLNRLAESIRPRVCSGSVADILEKRLILFKSLIQYENEEISSWAKNQYSLIQDEILRHREMEDRELRSVNESFE